ncbi:MAG: helix-turn-helix transcriptional regulator [Fimbriimonadaceae bacterium]
MDAGIQESCGAELLGSLDANVQSKDLAARAAYSLAQFHRLVRRSLNGSPMALRRRLHLERAAYELTHSRKSVTEIAFDAAFGSLEGFGRAFRRAYSLTPSAYRCLSPTDFRYDLTARLHYAPSSALGPGATQMATPELMIEHHAWHLTKLLDIADTWSDAELDRTMVASEPFPWLEKRATIRQMLGRSAGFAAPWMHAINGIETEYSPEAVPLMRAALDRGRVGFVEIIRSVERDRSWDLTFVDSVCEPPEVFSYRGVIGHVLTYNAYRRFALVSEFRALGYTEVSFGDPIDFERRAN